MNEINEKIPIISELEEKLKDISPLNTENKEELLKAFKIALGEIDDTKIKYLQLLELVSDLSSDFNRLYQDTTEANLSECVDKLYEIGSRGRKNPILKKSFESMGYRLMEQTRAGRKDDVFHNLMRLYITSKQPFDKSLLIAFKQSNKEMFKVLMFSFLSGIIEPKK